MCSKNRCAILPPLYVPLFCSLFCSSLFCFLRKYHASHVMMKIGRMSAPGTSSNKDTIPIQRNITRQAIIPTTSNTSPTTGKSKTAATYSLMSNTKQSMSENNSTSLKTKYSGKGLTSLLRFPKPLSPCNNNKKSTSKGKYKMRLRARMFTAYSISITHIHSRFLLYLPSYSTMSFLYHCLYMPNRVYSFLDCPYLVVLSPSSINVSIGWLD